MGTLTRSGIFHPVGSERRTYEHVRVSVRAAVSDLNPEALIVDWGSVLTSPLAAALDGWYAAEGIDAAGLRRRFATSTTKGSPRSASSIRSRIGRGSCGSTLRAGPGRTADPILRRAGACKGAHRAVFAGFSTAPAMINVIRRSKQAGLRTALLSNSWGNDYLRDDWDTLFDAVVISGEVGMRKPEPEIYLHTLDLLGCAPEEAVFVDDLDKNVRGAAAVGIIGVHHQSYEETIIELEALFELDLHVERTHDAPTGGE